MIIFGSRTWSKLLATLNLLCRNCHNPAAQHVFKRSTFFTLFFIPVIPLYFRRYLTCTYCGVSYKLGKDEADQLIANAQGPADQPPAAPGHQGHQGHQGQPVPPTAQQQYPGQG